MRSVPFLVAILVAFALGAPLASPQVPAVLCVMSAGRDTCALGCGPAAARNDGCLLFTQSCLEAGAWGVTGATSGTISDRVRYYVSCGDTEIAWCEASGGMSCDSGLQNSQAGDIGCYYAVVRGSPTHVSGGCYDPLRPDAVLVALPWGAPEMEGLAGLGLRMSDQWWPMAAHGTLIV